MTMLPPSSDATGASITEGQFKTFIVGLRAFLYEKLGDDGSVAIQAFPADTRMLFQQTAAPTGWTKDTTQNDKALRVVSGTVGSGGSVAFSTVFGRQATDGHMLTTAQMPSHSHSMRLGVTGGSANVGWIIGGATSVTASASVDASGSSLIEPSAGSGNSHSHNIDIRVQYVDLIIATKD